MIQPVPGQPWSIYHPGPRSTEKTEGIGCGERNFVVADVNARSVVLIEIGGVRAWEVPAPEFAAMKRKTLLDTKPSKLATRIKRNMKEREAYGLTVDTEIAELALSALGWKETHNTDGASPMGIHVEPRTYHSAHAAARGARLALGKPDAEEGVHFATAKTQGGRFVMSINPPTKLANGPTGIARQYDRVAATAKPPKVDRATFAKAALAHAAVGLDALVTDKRAAKAVRRAKLAKAAGEPVSALVAAAGGKPAGKPTKAPKPKKAPKGTAKPARPAKAPRTPKAVPAKTPAKAAAPAAEPTIRVLAKANPKKPGSAAHKRFDLYRDGMTPAEFVAAGGDRADLSWDRRKGFIAITA